MIEIIPAIDILDGKCVRLVRGNFADKKIYGENPYEAAKRFEEAGIKRLHLVDLDGARTGKIVNIKTLEQIASGTKLIVDFGGGIKTDDDIKLVFGCGASLIAIGSVAVKIPELFFGWVEKYGAEKILLGADVRVADPSKKGDKSSPYCLVVSGWAEQTEISVFDFIKTNIEKGIKNIFCTDVVKDGMMNGTSAELYKKIILKFPEINLIASGGISSVADIEQLSKIRCSGAIIGRAVYEGKIKLQALSKFLC